MKDAYKQTAIDLLLGNSITEDLTALRGVKAESAEEEPEGNLVEKEENLKVGKRGSLFNMKDLVGYVVFSFVMWRIIHVCSIRYRTVMGIIYKPLHVERFTRYIWLKIKGNQSVRGIRKRVRYSEPALHLSLKKKKQRLNIFL